MQSWTSATAPQSETRRGPGSPSRSVRYRADDVETEVEGKGKGNTLLLFLLFTAAL